MNKVAREKAQRWDWIQRNKRLFISLNEEDLIEHVTELELVKRKGDNLSIDHIVPRVAIIDPRSWSKLSIQEAKEWVDFVNQWEDYGRLSDGTFWIASGLQCKANLRLVSNSINSRKRRLLSSEL